jgi:hypothetical protein
VAAEVLVPAVYTARHWNDLSASEKGLFIANDALSVVPVFGAATRGARAVAGTSRTGRITGAAKAVGAETVAQVRAPVDLVIHPIQTVKGTATGVKFQARNLQSLIENVAHPSKLPEAVITTSEGTVRLPVRATTSEAEAMAIRDRLMALAKRGDTPVIVIGKMRVELTRSPLMRELKGGLTHATPMGEAFDKGLKVEIKEGMPASEQGLFLSHEPLPRFCGASAFGKTGEKPTIWIASKQTAEKAVSSAKIYTAPLEGKVAEMESKLEVNTRLMAPRQRLFTRVGAMQQRVEILLETPLSKRQIAKLKALGLVESVKTIYTPAIKVSKFDGALTKSELNELSDIIAQSDRELAGRLRSMGDIIERGRYVPPGITRVRVDRTVGRGEARITTRERPTERTGGRDEPVRARDERGEERPPRGERPPERPQRPPREERPPTRPERPERPLERPERAERQERGGATETARKKPPSEGHSNELKIERVEGIPETPGVVSYKDGIVEISIYPPYRRGTRDIEYELLRDAQTGKGSQEATLRVRSGRAPRLLELRRGVVKTRIMSGRQMKHVRTGAGIVDREGRSHQQKRGSIVY